MLNNKLNSNFNYILHKYGVLFHFFIYLYILYSAHIHPNTFIYWAFLINLVLISYFNYVNGVALGIKQTLLATAEMQLEKEDMDDINRNN